MSSPDGPHYPSATDLDPSDPHQDFLPSAQFAVSEEGVRDVGLCFVGASMLAGYGDPKGLGWVGRVVARTTHPEVDVSAYNLGVRSQTSGEIMARWRSECAPRWAGRSERRLVLGLGANDLVHSLTTARSRLNLANILDEATTTGISAFVVGPTPVADRDLNLSIAALAEAQADVCARRGVPFVDCFRPLVSHEDWQRDLGSDGSHPGQVGYGLIAWLVLHNGWFDWMGISAG